MKKHATTSHRPLCLALVVGAIALLPSSLVNAAEGTAPSQRTTQQEPGARNNNPEGEGLTKSAPARISKADRSFVTKAAAGNLFEIQAAKLASSRATDPRIKEFAGMLARDHAKALEGLKAISVSHNYPLPDKVPADKQATLDRLASLSGKNFDAAFRQEVGLKDHEADIKLFESASRATRTPDIKAWIDATLPTLKAHLKHATEI
ncbi:DUF4142 domain-containing protein [Variovorax sp. J22R133]|uniref:DUF4142 domain-containing protein n=1 Tax=Variovorax brevis TaxID=3053503 RepID=UPI0025749856|nr:DUF4142 domain-containing protein [Variovorax sp. J22R133]MDM0116850.1 DUF4142 domain-containing protein [Variovorax sp. J22R133]